MFFRAMSYDNLYKQDAALPEPGTDGDGDMSEKFDMAKIDARFKSALAELENLERMKAATREDEKRKQAAERDVLRENNEIVEKYLKKGRNDMPNVVLLRMNCYIYTLDMFCTCSKMGMFKIWRCRLT